MFNLDEKINLIYNYNYNNLPNCYKLDNINHKKIKMDDIKISSKHKNVVDDILDNLLKGKFKVDTINGNQLVLNRYADELPIKLFIDPYSKVEKSIDMVDNKDSYFSYLLSNLVLNKKTPHLLLPIVNIDTRFNQISDILEKYDIFDNYMNQIQEGKISDLFSIRAKENFFNGITLKDYVKNNKNMDIKPLLFQVLHTLSVLQEEYPNFRHNGLNSKNIYIYEKDLPTNTVYKIGKNTYKINSKYDIKITNFMNSDIELLKNKNIPFSNKQNNYFDFHYLLNTLLYKDKLKISDPDTQLFIDEVLPKKLRGRTKNNYYLDSNVNLFSPINLLNHNYFKKYIIKNTNSKTSNVLTGYGNKKKSKVRVMRNVLGDQSKIKIGAFFKGSRKIKFENETNIKKPTKKNKIKRKLMKGGYNKNFTKPYRKEKNDPFISNDQRKVFKDKKDEAPPKREPPVLAEQKVYDTSKKPSGKPDYHPMFVPINNNNYPYYGKLEYPYNKDHAKIPVQKVYNISLANPTGDHTTENRVFEDMLPGDPYKLSFNTVDERKQLNRWVRSLIIDKNDGEEMNVTGGDNSLLSYIREGHLNPYSLKGNPYEDLSKDFLLYNAAYPIRFNREDRSLGYAKGAKGMNLRIYKLSLGAFRAKTVSKLLNYHNFDVWREIKYYEYIRENILKTNISPNFISMFLYKTDYKSNIDWNKLNDIIYKKDKDSNFNYIKAFTDVINNKHSIKSNSLLIKDFFTTKNINSNKLDLYKLIRDKEAQKSFGVRGMFNKVCNEDKLYYRELDADDRIKVLKIDCKGNKFIYDHTIKDFKKDSSVNSLKYWNRCTNLEKCLEKEDININSSRSLVAVTEAPTTNIIKWGSPIYQLNGSIKTMIATGHHSDKVWKSILFQLTYLMTVLQKHEIYFERMTLENNIYIKDIFSNPENSGYWEYKVNGVDFFIPNYGSIVVFDSRYVDVHREKVVTLDDISCSDEIFKIYSPKLFKENGLRGKNKDDVKKLVKNAYKHMIRTLHPSIKQSSGNLSEKIIKMLGDIYNDKERDLSKYLLKYFKEYLNARVGTSLTKDEVSNLNIHIPPQLKKGHLAVIQNRYNDYRWGMVIGKDNSNPNKYLVIENKTDDIRSVFKHKLINYPNLENVSQFVVDNVNYNRNNIIDKYILE